MHCKYLHLTMICTTYDCTYSKNVNDAVKSNQTKIITDTQIKVVTDRHMKVVTTKQMKVECFTTTLFTVQMSQLMMIYMAFEGFIDTIDYFITFT